MIPLSGWRAAIAVVVALLVLAVLLTALFWLGVLLAALAVVAWLNIFLLPNFAARSHIPELVLAVALLPIMAAAGLGLSGTTGLIVGSALWLLGVAFPRALLWRLRTRVNRHLSESQELRSTRVVETTFRSSPYR